MKGLIRFALAWLIAFLLTPRLNALVDRLAHRAPEGSVREDFLLELSRSYSTTLVGALTESLGDIVFGAKG